MSIVDFLLARISEDEMVAAAVPTGIAVTGLPSSAIEHLMNFAPARVLAECDAKRRIVDWAAPLSSDIRREPAHRPGVYNTFIVRYPTDEGEDVLRLLALPYADHLEYNEAWRP